MKPSIMLLPQSLLILIRGLPGSGKTTLAGAIALSYTGLGLDAVTLCADDYMVDDDGYYKFEPDKLSSCHAACQVDAYRALEAKKTVIVHNTFTQQWELQPYRDMAEVLGVPIQEITVKGPWKNTHGCPDSKIEQMKARWEE